MLHANTWPKPNKRSWVHNVRNLKFYFSDWKKFWMQPFNCRYLYLWSKWIFWSCEGAESLCRNRCKLYIMHRCYAANEGKVSQVYTIVEWYISHLINEWLQRAQVPYSASSTCTVWVQQCCQSPRHLVFNKCIDVVEVIRESFRSTKVYFTNFLAVIKGIFCTENSI